MDRSALLELIQKYKHLSAVFYASWLSYVRRFPELRSVHSSDSFERVRKNNPTVPAQAWSDHEESRRYLEMAHYYERLLSETSQLNQANSSNWLLKALSQNHHELHVGDEDQDLLQKLDVAESHAQETWMKRFEETKQEVLAEKEREFLNKSGKQVYASGYGNRVAREQGKFDSYKSAVLDDNKPTPEKVVERMTQLEKDAAERFSKKYGKEWHAPTVSRSDDGTFVRTDAFISGIEPEDVHTSFQELFPEEIERFESFARRQREVFLAAEQGEDNDRRDSPRPRIRRQVEKPVKGRVTPRIRNPLPNIRAPKVPFSGASKRTLRPLGNVGREVSRGIVRTAGRVGVRALARVGIAAAAPEVVPVIAIIVGIVILIVLVLFIIILAAVFITSDTRNDEGGAGDIVESPIPGLSVLLDAPDKVPNGAEITFSIVASYSGSDNVEVIANFPPMTQFVRADGVYQDFDNLITWSLRDNVAENLSEPGEAMSDDKVALFQSYGFPRPGSPRTMSSDELFRWENYVKPHAEKASQIVGVDIGLIGMWPWLENRFMSHMDNCGDADGDPNTPCNWNTTLWQVGWGIFPQWERQYIGEAMSAMHPGKTIQQVGQAVIDSSRSESRYPPPGTWHYNVYYNPYDSSFVFPDISLDELLNRAETPGDLEAQKLVVVLMKDDAIGMYILAKKFKGYADNNSNQRIADLMESWPPYTPYARENIISYIAGVYYAGVETKVYNFSFTVIPTEDNFRIDDYSVSARIVGDDTLNF